jgi:hypothetical protein
MPTLWMWPWVLDRAIAPLRLVQDERGEGGEFPRNYVTWV